MFIKECVFSSWREIPAVMVKVWTGVGENVKVHVPTLGLELQNKKTLVWTCMGHCLSLHKYLHTLSPLSLCPSVEDMGWIPEELLVCFCSSQSEWRFMEGEMGSAFIWCFQREGESDIGQVDHISSSVLSVLVLILQSWGHGTLFSFL